jgi:hypothetical protein
MIIVGISGIGSTLGEDSDAAADMIGVARDTVGSGGQS